MTAHIRMSPGVVHRAAADVGAGGDAIRAELARLRRELAGLNRPWGDDAQGRAFAAGYLPRARVVQDALAALAVGLDSVDAALRASARNVESADTASMVCAASAARR